MIPWPHRGLCSQNPSSSSQYKCS